MTFKKPGAALAHLTTAQAAGVLGVASATLKRWTKSGLVRCIVTHGGHRRFERLELHRLLALRTGEGDGLDRFIRSRLGDPDNAVVAALHVERGRLGSWHAVADALVPRLKRWAERALGRSGATGSRLPLEMGPPWLRIARALARCSEHYPPRKGGPAAILAALGGTRDALTLAFAEVSLRERGWNVLWVTGLPLEEIAGVIDRGEAKVVVVGAAPTVDAVRVARELNLLAAVCRSDAVELLACGETAWPLFPGLRAVRTFAALDRWLEESGDAPRPADHSGPRG